MRPSFDAMLDELEKIAIKLTDEERRTQALQFAGLGAVTGPLVSGASNLAAHGKVSPWASKGRWLAATAGAGAVTGGLLPSIRHHMERRTQDKARARARVERQARLAAQGAQ